MSRPLARWSNLLRHGFLGVAAIGVPGTAVAGPCDQHQSQTLVFNLGAELVGRPRVVWGLEGRRCVSDAADVFARVELHGLSPRLVAGARARPFWDSEEGLVSWAGAEAGAALLSSRGGLEPAAHLALTLGPHHLYGALQGLVRFREVQARTEVSLLAGFAPWAGPSLVVEGRPIRTAAGWLLPTATSPASLPTHDRVTAHFVRAAQHEYSSVWTFLRLAAELRAVGAPTDLIEAALDAADDEVRHAEACAQAAGGISLAPLPATAAAPRFDRACPAALAVLADEAWREGCLGEGAAAREAELAADDADGDTGAMLAGIARDEAAHAELSWQVLAWATAQGAMVPTGHDQLVAPRRGGVTAREIAAGVPRLEVRRHAVIEVTERAKQRRAALLAG